jgi:predicted nucleic acid-binding protein
MKIYDSSAFFEAASSKTLDAESFILDLTFYEVGNVVMKHASLLKDISKEDAESFVTILANWNKVLFIQQDDLKEIFSIAFATRLTFYDSAYVYFAKKYGAILETQDKKLSESAGKFCKVKLI